jgi:AbrB family looped-hinge helix DNA binding protein
MARAKITRNYQVTIPEEVRKKVRLVEGDMVEIEAISPKEVRLRRIIPLDELEGAWADDPSVDKAMQEVRGLWKAWKAPKKSV